MSDRLKKTEAVNVNVEAEKHCSEAWERGYMLLPTQILVINCS